MTPDATQTKIGFADMSTPPADTPDREPGADRGLDPDRDLDWDRDLHLDRDLDARQRLGAALGPVDEYGPVVHATRSARGADGPRVIMVGTDGTVTSLRAAAYAAGLARRQRCRLVVAFVAAPSALNLMGSVLGAAAQEEAFEEIAGELRDQVRQIADEHRLPVTFVRRRGDPYAELRRTADEIHADLLVVGASMQPGHRLAGSVAGRLVRAGRWPVAVVP